MENNNHDEEKNKAKANKLNAIETLIDIQEDTFLELSTLRKTLDDIHSELSNIRKWVMFFGVLTIFGLIIFIASSIAK